MTMASKLSLFFSENAITKLVNFSGLKQLGA